MRESPAHFGWYQSGQMGLRPLRKETEQVRRREVVGSAHSWTLLQFLPLSSCLKLLPWSHLMLGCSLTQINLFLQDLVMVFITKTENKLIVYQESYRL